MWLSLTIVSLVVAWLGSFINASTVVERDHGILKRQTWKGGDSILGQIPGSCQSTCGPIQIITTQCHNSTCTCTVPNYTALKICVDCIVDYGTGAPTYDALRSRGQAALSDFDSDCAQQGVHLAQLELNPSPAPGPPGNNAITGATHSDSSSNTSSSTGRPPSSGSSLGIGGGGVSGLPFPLASAVVAVVAGSAVVAF